jgi:hypothetical protein
MKGTPKKNATIDISAAIESANSLTERTVKKEPRPENEKTMFVNLRFREGDHKRLGHLAVSAGITKAEFCKRAALYLADMVEAGAYSINSGNILDRRGL